MHSNRAWSTFVGRKRTCKHNIEARSRNYCCRGKAVSITYSDCISAAFFIRHATRVHFIVIGGLSGFTQYFPRYLTHGTIFGNKLLNTKCVFWYTQQLLSETFFILRKIKQDITINVRRWADKFCLHCDIFIYIRHIWIKPVLCSRMVSLFHHTSPWTHRCLQCSPSAHRNGRVIRRSVQTACCYWILNRRKSSSNWNSQTNASRLWRSACWCEYSKTLGKAVDRVEVCSEEMVSKTKNHFFKNGFQKLAQRWRKCIEVLVILWENNYAVLKIIVVSIFLFLFQ